MLPAIREALSSTNQESALLGKHKSRRHFDIQHWGPAGISALGHIWWRLKVLPAPQWTVTASCYVRKQGSPRAESDILYSDDNPCWVYLENISKFFRIYCLISTLSTDRLSGSVSQGTLFIRCDCEWAVPCTVVLNLPLSVEHKSVCQGSTTGHIILADATFLEREESASVCSAITAVHFQLVLLKPLMNENLLSRSVWGPEENMQHGNSFS